MGRSHPVGIVLAAILFGMLYQGGAELAFDMPTITRDMIVVIQGLVILFAGALEHMFRPSLVRLFTAVASMRPRRREGAPWIASTPSSRSSTRPSACRCRCSSPASPGSIPSAPASSTSASRARCWPPPSPPAAAAAVTGSAWLGLVAGDPRSRSLLGAGPRLRLDHPSRQPDRLGRRDQLPRRRA